MTEKTATEILRELREGMTKGEWGRPNWPKFSPETRPGDARGIVAIVNALPEIVALVEAADEEVTPSVGQQLAMLARILRAKNRLRAKLREETKR